jgi:hypothetical protein
METYKSEKGEIHFKHEGLYYFAERRDLWYALDEIINLLDTDFIPPLVKFEYDETGEFLEF